MKKLLTMMLAIAIISCMPIESDESKTKKQEKGYIYEYLLTYKDGETETVFSQDADPDLLEGGVVEFHDSLGVADRYIAVQRWELISKKLKEDRYEY